MYPGNVTPSLRSLISPLQSGVKLTLDRLRRFPFNQFANQIKAVPGELAVILTNGIDRNGQRIIEIVIVEAGQTYIALQQVMLPHIAQHPFQQTAGGGKESFWRTAQTRAKLGKHFIAGAGMVITMNDPLRT